MDNEYRRRLLKRRGVECPRCGTLHLIKSFPQVEMNSERDNVACRCGETIGFRHGELAWYEVSEKTFEQGLAPMGEWKKVT
jgi:hypothetical protein